jgi:hypothetical protein
MPQRKKTTKRARSSPASKRAAKKAVSGGRVVLIPNDPEAVTSLPARVVSPHADRGTGRATFVFGKAPAVAQYPLGTDGFLFWQSREAALRTLDAYEAFAGPFKAWAPAARSPLPLRRNAGSELNAYYDRNSVSFFEYGKGTAKTFSGASTDVVSHEIGHGLLDALRPDLWFSNLPEHGAFHEAFGDCIAMLTALGDPATRTALLAVTSDLGAANFVEAVMEDLAAGVRRALGPGHPAAQPRHGFNAFKWRLPSLLPTAGGPAVLTGEAHSFARVFTGCFYDTIRFIFSSYTTKTAATLATAAKTAGTLLVQGARNAVEQARFFQAVGEAMLQVDSTTNGGANQVAVTSAFHRHGVSLAPPARAFGARGAVGRTRGAAASGGAASMRHVETDVKRRLGVVAGTRLARVEMSLGGERVDKFVNQRAVPLDTVHPRLRGVVAHAPEPVVVGGARRGAAAVRSAVPDSATTDDEVRYFVESLLERGSIAMDGDTPLTRTAAATRGATRGAVAGVSAVSRPTTPQSDVITHVVRTRGGKKVLERIRFACCFGCEPG